MLNDALAQSVERLIENWLYNYATPEQIYKFASEENRSYEWAEELARAMDAQSTELHGEHIGFRLFSQCAFEVFERGYPRHKVGG